MAEAATGGSAGVQSGLWSERARDWADVMEGWNGWGIPLYRHVLERVPMESGTAVLDIGCGAGRFCRIAADRGATVAGLDATEALLEIARERVRAGDLRLGDMEDLPWEDDSFDLVTGFNSFFIARDMVGALREARRVARPGGTVAMTVFGRPERCDSSRIFREVAQLMQAGPSKGGGGRPLHEEGSLDDIAAEAGLTPREGGLLEFAEEYPDLETLLRGYTAAPPQVRAARAAGDEKVREAVARAVEPLELPTGGYRLNEEIRYLIATA